MRMSNTCHLFAIAIATLLLAACNQRPAEHADADKASSAPTGSATTTANAPSNNGPSRAKVTLEPAGLPACTPAKPAVVTIGWEVTDTRVATVDVKVLAEQGREDLFANGGQQGSKQTGEWMLPGSTIVVRDQATGIELGRASVESLPCAQ